MLRDEEVSAKERRIYLIFALLVAGALVYLPHWRYGFPFHVDEWYHLSIARSLKEQDLTAILHQHDPAYLGFHLILIAVGAILPASFPLVRAYSFLPAINVMIAGVTLYFLLIKKFNFWVGILSIIFLSALPSNINILGIDFFVPHVAVITLIYLTLFLLDRIGSESKVVPRLSSALFVTAIIHPSSAMVLGATIAVYFILSGKGLRIRPVHLVSLLAILVPAYLIFNRGFSVNQIGMFLDPKKLMDRLAWKNERYLIAFNPFALYGWIYSAFALVGFIHCFRKKELLPIRIYFVIALFNLLAFPLIGRTFFSSYPRYLYHFMLAAVPLSAVGLSCLVAFAKMLFANGPRFRIRPQWIFVPLVLTGFLTSFSKTPGLQFYQVIDKDDYLALEKLGTIGKPSVIRTSQPTAENLKQEALEAEVIIPPTQGTAIRSIAGKSPLAKIYPYHAPAKRAVTDFFRTTDCGAQREILNAWPNLKYIYSKREIICPFAKTAYLSSRAFIYSIDRSEK